jgi:hypothetical protein
MLSALNNAVLAMIDSLHISNLAAQMRILYAPLPCCLARRVKRPYLVWYT